MEKMLKRSRELSFFLSSFVLVFLTLSLSRCVSTGLKTDQVKWGMDESQVLEVAGKPDESKMQGNEVIYRYSTQDKYCEVVFVLGRVNRIPICTSEAQKKKNEELENFRSDWIRWGKEQDIEHWSVQKKQEYLREKRLQEWMVAHPSPKPIPSMRAPIIEKKEKKAEVSKSKP